MTSSCLTPHFGKLCPELIQPVSADETSDSSDKSKTTNLGNASEPISSASPPPPPPPRTFNVDFKTRHNGSLDRYTTLREVSSVIQSLDSRNLVDYDDPSFTVAVEVVGKTLCLALLKNYKANKKYNLQQFGGRVGRVGGGIDHGVKDTSKGGENGIDGAIDGVDVNESVGTQDGEEKGNVVEETNQLSDALVPSDAESNQVA